MSELIVVGGGELARVVVETARDANWQVIGFVDPRPCEETTKRLGVPRLGDDDALSAYPNAKLILGIGCVSVSPARRNIVEHIRVPPSRWLALTHPFASVSSSAELSEGVIVLPGAVIATGARIGRHCIINIGAKIDHDVRVGEFVHVAPQVALGGGSKVGDGAYVGMGAVVRDHVTVAERTMVGMGAVVTKEFAAGATLVGIPAKALTRAPGQSEG
jgi:acetyltransferase EpsM